jgi:chromosome partitioning protein
MTRKIAVINLKGGVGKTTSVASLGAALSEMGKRVLLVDLDAQSNLTSSLWSGTPTRTIYNSLTERRDLPLVEVKNNLYLTPSSLELAGVELELASTYGRETILRDLLKEQEAHFDYIIMDCPPSLGLISVNAIVASTEIYVPMTAEALPYKGMELLTRFLGLLEKSLNRPTSISGIIITRYNRTKNLTKVVEEDIRAIYKDKVFTTNIRENVSLAESPLQQTDIYSYAPRSNGAEDYRQLAKEVECRHRPTEPAK